MSFPTIRLLEGTGRLPLSFQLKNNLKHAISSGHLQPRTQMPSVRDLADQLGIAANTVAKAYKELQDDGLLVTYVGKGTFVADIITHFELGSDDLEDLTTIMRPGVDTARALGFTQAQIAQAVSEIFAEPVLRVGLVGINQVVVEKWKRILEQEFADLGIHVTAVTIADLQDDYERVIEELDPCYYILSLVTTYAETRAFFRDFNKKVVAIITEISLATHEALANLPHDETIGLVCEDMYLNNLLSVVSYYIRPERIKWVAAHDRRGIVELLKATRHILHTISPKQLLTDLALPDSNVREIEFLPNRNCFDQMRHMFLRAAQPA